MFDIKMCKTRVNALTKKKKNTEEKGKNTLKMFISLFFLMSLYIPKLKNEFSLLFLLSPILFRKDTE